MTTPNNKPAPAPAQPATPEAEHDDRKPAGKLMLTLTATVVDASTKFNKNNLKFRFKLPNGFEINEKLSEDERNLLKMESKKEFKVEIYEDKRPDGTTWARAIVYMALDWRKGFFLEKIAYQAYKHWRDTHGGDKK